MEQVCIKDEELRVLNGLPLSRAYVPDQCFTAPVSPEEGLKMGTIWKELYDPYKGGRR